MAKTKKEDKSPEGQTMIYKRLYEHLKNEMLNLGALEKWTVPAALLALLLNHDIIWNGIHVGHQ